MTKRTVKLGVVGVDSGILMVCDPCYIKTEFIPETDSRSIDGEFSYEGVCRSTTDENGGQLNYRLGHPGAAVAFSSGMGDGVYTVMAELTRGNFGERVTKVWIEFPYGKYTNGEMEIPVEEILKKQTP
jgi:hypothetical protein